VDTAPKHEQQPVDLSRLYGARDLDELREEYDRIAGLYDADTGDGWGWLGPAMVLDAAVRVVPRDALALDAGAGTGLLGVAMREAGYTRLHAMDMSLGMLAEAERKGVYLELHEGRLGDPLDYADAAYDAVVASGVLTTGHAPASCLPELVRITRPGGHVVFTLRSDETPPGFTEQMTALEDDGSWELVTRGAEVAAMPHTHPEVLLRAWTYRVTW
jgi:SAM-dependent methyltransferase